MAFPPEFLDEIRLRLPVSDVVGRRVKLLRRGREFSGLCPFHKEKTPSFTVNDEKSFYHCFGCGAHGDVIRFVCETEGLSFPEAVERLAGEAGLEVPRESPEERQRAERRVDLMKVLDLAASWFEARLAGPEGRQARDYLARRGLGAATAKRFRLGYAPDRRGALQDWLRRSGVGDEMMVEAGLAKRPEEPAAALRDYFFDRLMFPVTDRRGRVIAFGARTMGDSPAKYINSPEGPLFHKGRVLYNLAGARQAAHAHGEIVVAEGYMDVIALCEAGFPASVAPLGTAVTDDQIRELWRLAKEPIFCLDGDDAGRRAAFRAAERALGLLEPGYSLRFCWLPEGQDPDSFLRTKGAAAFRQLLSRPESLCDLLWQRETEGGRFTTPERRAALRQALAKTVKPIKDPELREDYYGELMARYERAFPPRSARHAGRRNQRLGQGATTPILRAPPSPDGLAKRQEQLLLALLINHPFILEDYSESLAAMRLGHAQLDIVRQALVDLVALVQSRGLQEGEESLPLHLDSALVECHLRDLGFDEVLSALQSPEVLLHGRFARPGASEEAAREGFSHVMALIDERSAEGSLAEMAEALGAVMDEPHQARLSAARAELQVGESRSLDSSRYAAVEEGDH